MNFISFAQLHDDIKEFSSRVEADLVVGIPRSGIFVANLIALHKNIPFGIVSPGSGYITLKGGFREKSGKPGKILVIDDSLSSGTSMVLARDYMKYHRAKYGAFYSTGD